MKTKKPIAVYARVSTEDKQDLDGQVKRVADTATRLGYAKKIIFAERASGDTHDRPELKKLLEAVDRRRIGAVIVERIDRLSRSVRQLIFLIDNFHLHGVDFIAVRQNIDTTSPSGRFFFTVMAAFAELERELISERVRIGLESARQKGVELGRPRIPPETVDAIYQLRDTGETIQNIAETLLLSPTTVKKYLGGRK